LDYAALGHSWALQACQLWELLRDANLLCRHVSLLQVGDMLRRATAPPPAVLQHRQQVRAGCDMSQPQTELQTATTLLLMALQNRQQ
jgi:hypothetical protein